MTGKAIPEGYHSITPYLAVHEAGKLIDFLKRSFDAQEVRRHTMPDGTVANAEIKIGDSMVMIGEAPKEHSTMKSMLYHYVSDVDSVYQAALAAGGASVREPQDQYYGERVAGVADPAGNQWWIATREEDLSTEEMAKRMTAMLKQKSEAMQ